MPAGRASVISQNAVSRERHPDSRTRRGFSRDPESVPLFFTRPSDDESAAAFAPRKASENTCLGA